MNYMGQVYKPNVSLLDPDTAHEWEKQLPPDIPVIRTGMDLVREGKRSGRSANG